MPVYMWGESGERKWNHTQYKKDLADAISGKSLILLGAGGETRTLMDVSPEDFESSASTSFTTPA